MVCYWMFLPPVVLAYPIGQRARRVARIGGKAVELAGGWHDVNYFLHRKVYGHGKVVDGRQRQSMSNRWLSHRSTFVSSSRAGACQGIERISLCRGGSGGGRDGLVNSGRPLSLHLVAGARPRARARGGTMAARAGARARARPRAARSQRACGARGWRGRAAWVGAVRAVRAVRGIAVLVRVH